MLSLAELRRVVGALAATLAQARLQRVVQPDAWSVVLTFYGAGEETHLLLSCRSGFARVARLGASVPAPPSPPAFAQYLRAHLRGVRFSGARLLGEDRQAAIRLDGADGSFELVLSLLGVRSNVYLLDADGTLRASLRPLPVTRRDLAVGEPFTSPATAPPRQGEDRWAEVEEEELLAAIEASYADLEAAQQRDDLLRQLGSSLDKEARFLERRTAKLGQDLASATGATEARRLGELLKSVLHVVNAGDTEVTATDYETGEEVAIPLDPKLSPTANLERLFARHQKAQKAVQTLEQQLAELVPRREKIARLTDELTQLGSAALEDLKAFAARAPVKELVRRHYPGRAAERGTRAGAAPAPSSARRAAGSEVPARLLPKVYRTEDGLEIWVGRSEEGNDYLTTRLARGNDLFFHVEGKAGSHVVLRTEGRKDPPSASLLDACELAVHFSKGRGDGRADVHVAAIKDVKKPRHAKPGLVQVMRGRTIHLRRDRARLERVLSSK